MNTSNLLYSCIAGGGVFAIILCSALVVCAIVAYFMAISVIVRAAVEKNAPYSKGMLWFIGLFTTPITLGVIVAAMPDRR